MPGYEDEEKAMVRNRSLQAALKEHKEAVRGAVVQRRILNIDEASEEPGRPLRKGGVRMIRVKFAVDHGGSVEEMEYPKADGFEVDDQHRLYVQRQGLTIAAWSPGWIAVEVEEETEA